MFQPHDRIVHDLNAHDRITPKTHLHFDDVMLQPDMQQCLPDQVNIASHFSSNIALHTPFILLPSVTDAATAIHMAQIGSIGIIPDCSSISTQMNIVQQVKRHQSRIATDTIIVTPETSIIEALEYKQRYQVSLMPVVEGGTQFLAGFIDIQDNMDVYDPEKTVSSYMSEQPYATIIQGQDEIDDAYRLMDSQNVQYVAVTDTQGRFIALIRKSDKEKEQSFPHATIDSKGALRVAAMVGTGSKDYERINTLMDVDVDVILVYDNHGHSKELLDIITHIRRQRSAKVDVIAGNIMTEQAAIAAIDAGANGILVGQNKAYAENGIGIPALAAVMQVAQAASLYNIPVLFGAMDIAQPAIDQQIKLFAAGCNIMMTDQEDRINSGISALRKAISFTGFTQLQDFSRRSNFIRTR